MKLRLQPIIDPVNSDLTRRKFLLSSMAAMAATSAASHLTAAPKQDPESWPQPAPLPPARQGGKPNVILIMLDDLGSIDTNAYGAKDLVTPNLDALAARGTRFTQCCAAAPLCSPSRGAVLTGRFPLRNGLQGNAASHWGGTGELGLDEITLPQLLKADGYVTGHIGKWHLGYRPESMPLARGFDSSFGHMGGCIDNFSHFFYWGGPNRHDLWDNGHETWREGEHIGDLAVRHCHKFLEEQRDKPFFLFWGINHPHYPLQGKAKWRDYYSNLPSPRNMYAASVSTADEMIGQVMDKVRQLGLEENTIVVVQSDHGHSTEDRAFFGGGNAGPYRGAKSSMFEGGIRVVSMISWPGKLPEGQVRGQLVTGCDWVPTLCELTGAPLPKRRLDGKSMLPVIRSATSPTQHQIFHWQLNKQWAVREGNWKLIGNPIDTSQKAPITEADKLFLCDLEHDISEMTNLASQHPDIVNRLKSLHEQWLNDVQDRS